MWQVLNEWPFPSLFQQESEKTEYTRNAQGSSAWKISSTSDSENYGEIRFPNMCLSWIQANKKGEKDLRSKGIVFNVEKAEL